MNAARASPNNNIYSIDQTVGLVHAAYHQEVYILKNQAYSYPSEPCTPRSCYVDLGLYSCSLTFISPSRIWSKKSSLGCYQLVQRRSILTVLKIFALLFFMTSMLGPVKHFSVAVILEPPVQMLCGFVKEADNENRISLTFLVASVLWSVKIDIFTGGGFGTTSANAIRFY